MNERWNWRAHRGGQKIADVVQTGIDCNDAQSRSMPTINRAIRKDATERPGKLPVTIIGKKL